MDQPQRTTSYPTAGAQAHHLDTGELAENRLRASAYLALQHISCEFRAGVLTLRGRLPSYCLRQVALAAVALVEGVQRIDDQIEVVHAPPIPFRGQPCGTAV